MGGVYYIYIVNLIFLYIEHMRRYILRIPSKSNQSNQSNQLLADAAAHMANPNAQTRVTILSASEKRKQKFIWKPTLIGPALV